MRNWDDVEAWLRSVAEDDRSHDGCIRPTLVAFATHRPLLMVRCRAFAAGEGAAALREILDIALPLGADRIAMSFGGRAWKVDGHARPRDDRSTLREILLIAVAQRSSGGVDLRCALHEIERARCGPAIERSSDTHPVAGWLPRMLTAALAAPPAEPASREVIAARAVHSITLGHELHVPDGQHATTQ